MSSSLKEYVGRNQAVCMYIGGGADEKGKSFGVGTQYVQRQGGGQKLCGLGPLRVFIFLN